MMTLAGIIATIVVSFIALWPKRKRNSKPMTPGSKFDLGAGAVNAYRKMTTDKMS